MNINIENICLATINVIARIAFYIYRALPILVVVGGAILLDEYWFYKRITWRLDWVYLVVIISFVLLILTKRPTPKLDNPFRKYFGAQGWIDSLVDRFIAWIGTLKYFTSPLCMVEDPGSYKIKGPEIRELVENVLQSGDILLRGFDGYIDGIFIRHSGGAEGIGAFFSHAAIYLGELTDADIPVVARRLEIQDKEGNWLSATEQSKNEVRKNTEYFYTGKQMVVHAMTRGVFVEDILTFLRCDYLLVLRLPDSFKLSVSEIQKDRSLIGDLATDAETIRINLMEGNYVDKNDVIKAAHDSALGKIGSCYDFQFNDIKNYHYFSCSEFVYYCYKSIHCYLGLEPKKRGFFKILFTRKTITPPDIYELANSEKKLQIVWKSNSLKAKT